MSPIYLPDISAYFIMLLDIMDIFFLVVQFYIYSAIQSDFWPFGFLFIQPSGFGLMDKSISSWSLGDPSKRRNEILCSSGLRFTTIFFQPFLF